jgi:hypothetical protein
VLIDRQGNRWNDYRPMRVFNTDAQGRTWRLPRHWLTGAVHSNAPQPDSRYPVTREHVFPETLHLTSRWDLLEINIPSEQAEEFSGKPVKIEVRLSPDTPLQCFGRMGQVDVGESRTPGVAAAFVCPRAKSLSHRACHLP